MESSKNEGRMQRNKSNFKYKSAAAPKTPPLNLHLQTILDPYFIIDLQGNITKINRAAKKVFCNRKLELPCSIKEIIFKEDIPKVRAALSILFRDGYYKDLEARIFFKEGTVKWIKINCNLIYDGNKKPSYAQGTIHDISQQKKEQQDFEEHKNKLNTVIDNASLGIVFLKEGRIIRCNKTFKKLIKYESIELQDMKIEKLFSENDISKYNSYIEQLEKKEIDNFSLDNRYVTKSGEIFWAKTNVSRVKTDTKNLPYYLAVIEDVTGKIQHKSMLKALNSLMSSILGKTDIYEISWEITTNTTTLLQFEDCVIYLLDKTSNKLTQIAAYGAKIGREKTINNVLEIPIGNGIVGTVAKTGIAEIVNDTSKDSRYIVDDKIRYSEITVPIISDNEIIGVIDSEHSSKNYFTKYHLKTLETIANLVATQLKNALNLKLRKEADKKNKALLSNLTKTNKELKDFAHIVSHDLKSPLRAMDALVTWIQEENYTLNNSVITKNTNLLLKKIKKMDQLIHGILEYTSIDQVSSKRKKINTHKLVLELLNTMYVPKHICITIKNRLPAIYMDKFRAYQLFQNLVSNAIKYCDKKEGTICIQCEDDGVFWKFSIQDNGLGISPKYHRKIFEIFQTIESRKNSTGVGLSIVKKIIERNKGRIWLSSEINKGTTFFFTLPKN